MLAVSNLGRGLRMMRSPMILESGHLLCKCAVGFHFKFKRVLQERESSNFRFE